jgi:DHA2 family multidrug resistance protein
LQQIQQALVDNGTAVAQAMSAAQAQMYQMLQMQAAVMAYIEVFFLTALLSLVMVPAALLMSGIKTKSGG